MPPQEQRKGHEVGNENIQRHLSVKFPLKAVKFEILRIHEDNIITTIFTLKLLSERLGRDNRRQLTPTILSLRKIHQVE